LLPKRTKMASRRTSPAAIASPSIAPAVTPDCSLRGVVNRRFFRGPDRTLLEGLYIPMLSNCVRYDRSCAYFSSSSLAAAARGFGKLIERLIVLGDGAPRPAVRLLVNEELNEADVKALTEDKDARVLEGTLRSRFKDPKDWLERERLKALGWLVKSGLLEVRVGVMRREGGILHAKFGIASDARSDALVFRGSGNESYQGLLQNYEQLEVSSSWDDPDALANYSSEFDLLWGGNHPDVETHSLPEALRQKLIKFAPKEPPVIEPSIGLDIQRCAMVWQFIREAPYLPDGAPGCEATGMVDLWPHQRRVVAESAEAWPEGRLLCDEVGLGKTIEAIMILRRLLSGRGVSRVLFLLPAGLVNQWQGELREKGGLIIPRLDGNTLVWPHGATRRVRDLAEALETDLLLVSRETARTENNLPILAGARPWDLVVLDEAHAARRREQVEGEFNSGTLLLNLLRRLQLGGRVRGFLFLSATPMQTHPWEPWDLLSVLGEGGRWLADFETVRNYYAAIAQLTAGGVDFDTALKAASVIGSDTRIGSPTGVSFDPRAEKDVANRLVFSMGGERQALQRWLRLSSPLARRMQRNTRRTLQAYYERGLLELPPPKREVSDELFDFADPAERAVYDSITRYIQNRFEELEKEKAGKGFVMTIYRRRAASSPLALERSLQRRRQGLLLVEERRASDPWIGSDEAGDFGDLPDSDRLAQVSTALPEDPDVARAERRDIEKILAGLRDLGGRDSKLDRFFNELRRTTNDGRKALVFTEYTDTMEYLRDKLVSTRGTSLACYSGNGGERWTGSEWRTVTKDEITRALAAGEISLLICTDAASEGLNLQAAGAVINYDLPWNPSRVEQRIGRVDRIGQQLDVVRVVNLFLEYSIDERVYRVLRDRCGLFEHFVGPMQPVLARARRMLLGLDAARPEDLQAEADGVDRDHLGRETYHEEEPEPSASESPVGRVDLENALRGLPRESAFSVREKERSFTVSGNGLKKVVLSCRVECLEHDPVVQPLVPESAAVAAIGDSLNRKAGRTPLVVGSHRDGPFRASELVWIEGKSSFPVSSLGELHDRMGSWMGEAPNSEALTAARKAAEARSRTRVEKMKDEAHRRYEAALAAQKSAARERLLKELARFLAAHRQGMSDPNALMYEQLSRGLGSAERIRQALDRLSGYPDWPPAQCREAESYVSGLTDGQARGRLLGKELDAALQDPRWTATK
jgi:superfamily II DNA or RNA helicase